MGDITLTFDDINRIGLLGKLEDRSTIPLLEAMVRQLCLLYPVTGIKKERIPQERDPDKYHVTLQIDTEKLYQHQDSLNTALMKKIKWLEGLVIYLFEKGTNISPEDATLASQCLAPTGAIVRKEGKKNEEDNPGTDEIFTLVEADLGISREKILSNAKHRDIVRARSIVSYLMRQRYHLTYPEIGRRLAKNHATIILSERKFRDGHPEGAYTQSSLREAYNLAKSSYKT